MTGWNKGQISTLVKAGMPLASEGEARAWRELNQKRKRGAKPKFSPQPTRQLPADVSDLVAEAVGETGEAGVANTLKRLQEAERALGQRYVVAGLAAKAGEKPDGPSYMELLAAEKAALDNWVKVGQTLLNYDKSVEESRRDSGQLIPREMAELAIEMAATWLRLSVQTFKGSKAEELAGKGNGPRAAKIIDEGMADAVRVALVRAPECRVPLAPWAMECIRKGYGLPA